MDGTKDPYQEFVDHPRYGRRPILTGLNPSPFDAEVRLHWNATTHSAGGGTNGQARGRGSSLSQGDQGTQADGGDRGKQATQEAHRQ